MRWVASRSTRGTPAERRFRPGYIWAGRYFSTRIQESPRGGGKWVVVSAVRDPVARNVSSFFQNLRLFFDFDWHQRSRGEGQARAVGELRELFQSSFLNEEWLRMGMDSDPLTWLDTELRPALGIDVFREPFPTGRGYRIYSGTRARLLLFRLEDMDRCAGPAVEEFLGVRGFTLLPRNVASEKGYASLYRRFLDSLVLPDEYLDRMYGSRFSRHFYSEQELATFKNRWRRR